MFAGHFGLAAGVKAKTTKVPLWAIMLGTQLLDVAFVPLLLSGTETMEGEGGYGSLIIHADYSHSLLGALIISLLAGLVARRPWGVQGGRVIAAVVFSHWILDLIVHRADMPILPGNLGQFPLLGLGLWKFSAFSAILEFLLIAIGFVMYLRSALKRVEGRSKTTAIVSSTVLGIVLVFSLITDVFSLF